MNVQIELKPSLIAIFFNSNQVQLIPKIPKNLLESYFQKLEVLFSNTPIYTNIDISFLEKKVQIIESSIELDFLKKINSILPKSKSNDADIDEIFFVYCEGIFPLLSVQHTKEMCNRHTKYLSQYSYSENLPIGIVPKFLSREFMNTVPNTIPNLVHDFLIKNLNNYDTDIYYVHPDLRQYRLDFSLSSLRSIQFTQEIYKTNPQIEYTEILPFLLSYADLYRISPSYIEIELYRGCKLSCNFCPRELLTSTDDITMPVSFVDKILSDLNFWQSPVTISLAGMGEPLLYKELVSVIDQILDSSNVSELILETSLSESIVNLSDYLSKLIDDKKNKLTIIVNLSTLDSSKYKEMYIHSSGIDLVHSNLSKLSENLSKKNIHLQILKIKEVESEIETYYNHFEKLGYNIIIQKYNSYINRLTEKRVSDLTPIKREFCWHLIRDMYIRADGKVEFCKQTIGQIIGDIQKNTLIEIWNLGNESARFSLNSIHEKVQAPCLNCDEWYTFNA